MTGNPLAHLFDAARLRRGKIVERRPGEVRVLFEDHDKMVAIDGARVAVLGDDVAAHAPKHIVQILIEGAGFFTIEGRAISREGDRASCGHAASGADWIEIDDGG